MTAKRNAAEKDYLPAFCLAAGHDETGNVGRGVEEDKEDEKCFHGVGGMASNPYGKDGGDGCQQSEIVDGQEAAMDGIEQESQHLSDSRTREEEKAFFDKSAGLYPPEERHNKMLFLFDAGFLNHFARVVVGQPFGIKFGTAGVGAFGFEAHSRTGFAGTHGGALAAFGFATAQAEDEDDKTHEEQRLFKRPRYRVVCFAFHCMGFLILFALCLFRD